MGKDIQFSRSAVRICNPMDCSTPGFPVHHQLPELSQTYVHWISDVIQPCHPLTSPTPPAFSLSQSQGLFKWVSSSYQVAKVLELQLQHQSFQWIFKTDFILRLTALNLQSKEPSRVFYKHQSSKASILWWQLSLQSKSHIHTWLLEKP